MTVTGYDSSLSVPLLNVIWMRANPSGVCLTPAAVTTVNLGGVGTNRTQIPCFIISSSTSVRSTDCAHPLSFSATISMSPGLSLLRMSEIIKGM